MAGEQKETRSPRRKEKIRLNPSASNVTFLHKLAGFVGAGYLHFVAKTSSLHIWDHPATMLLRREKKPLIYAFWHNTQVFLAYAHRGEGVDALVSQSKDGEYIAQVMKRLGINAVRGSTSRGGEQALREICDLLIAGGRAAFTPDGPRGPLQTVQGGVVVAAQTSGAPVIPLTYIASRRIVFNSWDKFVVPLPFGSILLSRGEPFYLDKDLPLEDAKGKVRRELNRNEEQAAETIKALPGCIAHFVGFLLERLYAFSTMVFLPLTFLFLVARYGRSRTFRFTAERFNSNAPPRRFKHRFWLHAASIGEWQALRPVLARFKKFADAEFVVTVSTPEARALVEREEPDVPVRMLPLDLPWVVRRTIRKIQPTAAAFVETELWPNLLSALKEMNVPIFLINGRLSAGSLRNWRIAGPLARRLFRSFSAFFVRTDEDGRRFVRLGAPMSRVHVTGNTKVDNLIVQVLSPETAEKKRGERRALFGDAEGVLVAAGSTWPGEEEALLKLFAEKSPARLRFILAPRRLERVSEVRRLLEKIPASWSLWSKVKETRVWETDILLVDTLGDLKELIAVSDIGFVGGSLIPHGGQNPLEPAAAGIPVLFGPSMENFHEEAAELKRAGGARQARHEKDVLMDIRELAGDENLRLTAGLAAAKFVESKQGASDRTVAALSELLNIEKVYI